MKNFYFMTQYSFAGAFVLPYLWCSLKTYYEENGKDVNEWSWKDPFLYEKTDEEILKILEKDEPHVFGFSVYVWNEDRLDNLARQVKEKYPNCLIVYGGPQQNVKHNLAYFMEKTWVDISLFADAYGEVVLTKILDSYPGGNYDSVPSIYHTDQTRKRKRNLISIDKRKFVWPSNVFASQEHIIMDKVIEVNNRGQNIQVYYETSRGCPYNCIYCEWGGGVGSKVNKRPLNETMQDLEWMIKKAKVCTIEIADANFGMFAEDIEIAKYIAKLKVETRFPYSIEIDSAKNHPDNMVKIYDIFWQHDLQEVYKISFQTLSDAARDNVKRVDIPLMKHIESINYLKSRHGDFPIYLERIMGLPGETVKSVYEQLDTLYNLDLDIGISLPVAWVLLPEAEAFDPRVREKFKIKTVNKLFDHNPKLKDNRDLSYPASEVTVINNSWVNPTIETVIETYSYTSDEWLKMRHIFSWSIAGHKIGLNNYFLKYLNDKHKVNPSELYKLLVQFSENGFNIIDLDKSINIEKIHSYAWVNDENQKEGLIDLGESWPFLVPSHKLIILGLLTNIKDFYNKISEIFYEKYNDPAILDLAKWIANSTVDINYDPTRGRTFTSLYNWLDYFNNNGTLEKGNFTFRLDDYKDSDVSWHRINDILDHRRIAFYCEVVDSRIDPAISSRLRRVT